MGCVGFYGGVGESFLCEGVGEAGDGGGRVVLKGGRGRGEEPGVGC